MRSVSGNTVSVSEAESEGEGVVGWSCWLVREEGAPLYSVAHLTSSRQLLAPVPLPFDFATVVLQYLDAPAHTLTKLPTT